MWSWVKFLREKNKVRYMKAVWSGSIAFGLVNIPVKLYTVAEPKIIGFKILCNKCKTPLKYKRYCPKCQKEIEWSNVIKGLEISKGKLVALSKDELEKIKPEKSDVIEIKEFVDRTDIDQIYIDKHYYAIPEKEKEKAYFLFQEILSLLSKVAIGTFVMHEKERICVISAYKNGLLLTTLNYAYEIRDMENFEVLKERPKIHKEELKLAEQLIEKMSGEFHIDGYKDMFAEELKKLIKHKLEGKAIDIKRKSAERKKSLIEALKASVRS